MHETISMRWRYLFIQRLSHRLRILWDLFFEKIEHPPEVVPSNGPLIIASNHRTLIDHWLITLVFKRDVFERRIPMRFLAHPVWRFPTVGRPVVGFIWWLYGVISIDEDAIETLAALINNHGGTGLIYPEGRRLWGDKIGRFRVGVIDLAERTNAPILLCAIRFGKWQWFPWRGRTKCVIHFARKPLEIPSELNGWKAARFLREEVVRLYEEAGNYL